MKLFLDDLNPAPDGWTKVLWPDEAINLLERGGVTELSLDHDLGDNVRGTGYTVLLWIEDAVKCWGFTPPQMSVHSDDHGTRQKLERAIGQIVRLEQQRAVTA